MAKAKSSKKATSAPKKAEKTKKITAKTATTGSKKPVSKSKPTAKKPAPANSNLQKTGQKTTASTPANIKMIDTKSIMAKSKLKTADPIFAANDFVVYPTHGVGLVKGVETQEIAGHKLRLFVIEIEGAKMVVKVPINKANTVGLRRLSTRKEMTSALEKLKVKARVRRTMWSRRAQEYETKINSGSPVAIAEVVRELFRSSTQPDQSYSERQIYQSALDRLAREVAAIDRTDEKAAIEKIETMLNAA